MTTDAGLFTAMVVLWFDYVPGTNLELIVAYVSQAKQLNLRTTADRGYAGEWFNPATGERQSAHLSLGERSIVIEEPSWRADAVLLLKERR